MAKRSWRYWLVDEAYGLSIAAIGLLAKLFNQIGSHPWFVIFSILVAPITYVALEYSVAVVAVTYRRFSSYESLCDLLCLNNDERQHLEQRLLETEVVVQYLSQKLVVAHKIEIERVQVFKNNISLTLKPKRNLKLQIGNQVKVIDLTEGAVMGTFQITQIEPTCLAKALEISPIWSGYIHEMGPESSPPPNSAAILIEGDLNA
jgi:hypothetical protein